MSDIAKNMLEAVGYPYECFREKTPNYSISDGLKTGRKSGKQILEERFDEGSHALSEGKTIRHKKDAENICACSPN